MALARTGGGWGWWVMTLLSIGVGGYALFLTVTGFRFVPATVLANGFPSPLGIRIHIAAAALALLTGPWQFLRRLRAGNPALHRWTGRTYVLACTIGGLAGGSVAMFSTSGPIAGAGFLGLAICWEITTLTGWRLAMRRSYVLHERWMVRSFALTLAAVTLRIYLPPAIIANHGAFPVEAYRAIAWLCWVPNLLVAELYLWLRSRPRAAKEQAA